MRISDWSSDVCSSDLVVGQAGLVPNAAFRAGLFLLGPGIHYPLHTHAAAEVYYALSGRLTLAHGPGGAPFGLNAGSYSVTPPGRPIGRAACRERVGTSV